LLTNLGKKKKKKKKKLYWIKIGGSLALKNESKNPWKWVKKNAKKKKTIINLLRSLILLKIITMNYYYYYYFFFFFFTNENLKALHFYYKFLVSDSSGHSLSKEFWKDFDTPKNLENPRPQEWEINQDKNNEEICKEISSTPNFKDYGPGIPVEFFKVLIPSKDDSEESSKNNKNMSSGFKCFKAIINCIWNGDFPKL